MFHRRLLLLAGCTALVSGALLAQLVRLTIVQGEQRREEAERKLVLREWTPSGGGGGAGRGRILDRKGRILAQDRPSLAVIVDYSVLSGQWVISQGAAAARKSNRAAWAKMSLEERQAKVDEAKAVFQDHLDRMWQRIAEAANMPLEQLDRSRRDIVDRVNRRAQSAYASRLGTEIEKRLTLGEEVSIELEEEVAGTLRRPIVEQRSPHVLLPAVPDEVGFALMALAQQAVSLPGVADPVPMLPGVEVSPSSEREYPSDRISVEMDLSTLPPPVKGEGTRTITVQGVAYHILGRMKPKAQKEDADHRIAAISTDPGLKARVMTPQTEEARAEDRGRYFDDDPAGLTGIEASREMVLRGLRGVRTRNLELRTESSVPPERGRDVQLTLDIALQARIQAAMAPELGLAVAQEWHGHENPTVPVGTPLNGAAVVIEVDTGDILALVSTPSIPRDLLRESPDTVFGHELNKAVDVPWIDRAIARPYPPGSIAKAVVLNSAVHLGKLSLDSPIDCTGHLYPDKPDMFRCWAFKQYQRTHSEQFGHALSGPEALMVSCNIYFFTLGQRLGSQGIIQTYRDFGLGLPLDIGLDRPGQAAAVFPGFLGIARTDRGAEVPAPATAPGAVTVQDATQMGIGQGPVAWTPLHAADAYCTIARGGVRVRPHLINEPGAAQTVDLGLDRRAVRESLKGLHDSVNQERGTGHHLTIASQYVPHFNVPGVEVWGKTGTATAPTIFIERELVDDTGTRRPNPLWDLGVEGPVIAAALKDPTFRVREDRRVLRWGDHSWFVVLVGTKAEQRPRFAIAVMMEYAGSGGKVSGPIVNQVIHALKAEGYLE